MNERQKRHEEANNREYTRIAKKTHTQIKLDVEKDKWMRRYIYRAA